MSHPATRDAALQLEPLEIGTGRVQTILGPGAATGWRLSLDPSKRYADAQLDDYRARERRAFPWAPPLRFSLSARSSCAAPSGTFGFGFWNDPFSLGLGLQGSARRFPNAPQTAWYFYASPRSEMALQRDAPGDGWKTATLRSRRLPPAVLVPGSAAMFLGMHLAPLRRGLHRWMLRFLQAEESQLHFDPSQWHSYIIDWREDRVIFFMDGEIQSVSAEPPRPPLGLVIWIDNQYAMVSPERGIGFGVEPVADAQWLEVAGVRVQAS